MRLLSSLDQIRDQEVGSLAVAQVTQHHLEIVQPGQGVSHYAHYL